MGKRRNFTPEQIITKLREAEIHLGQGKTVKESSKLLEISEQTYYRWRREYGGTSHPHNNLSSLFMCVGSSEVCARPCPRLPKTTRVIGKNMTWRENYEYIGE